MEGLPTTLTVRRWPSPTGRGGKRDDVTKVMLRTCAEEAASKSTNEVASLMEELEKTGL